MDNGGKWYQKTWAIVLLLIIFFPIGLFLMWKYAKWNNKTKWVVTGIFATFLLLSNSSKSKPNTSPQPTENIKKEISYEIIKRWTIPNGGEGKVIVISPNNFNEADMVTLGDKLKSDTKNDRNAFIFIFTDKKAAEMRDRLSSTTNSLTKMEADYYDKHYVGDYSRNINSGYHQFTIYFDGVMGTNNKTIKY